MEEFQVHQKLVGRLSERLGEKLLEQDDFASYQRIVGGLKALEDVYGLPETIVSKLEELNVRRTESELTERRVADERRAHTYGTRLWRRMAGTDGSSGGGVPGA